MLSQENEGTAQKCSETIKNAVPIINLLSGILAGALSLRASDE